MRQLMAAYTNELKTIAWRRLAREGSSSPSRPHQGPANPLGETGSWVMTDHPGVPYARRSTIRERSQTRGPTHGHEDCLPDSGTRGAQRAIRHGLRRDGDGGGKRADDPDGGDHRRAPPPRHPRPHRLIGAKVAQRRVLSCRNLEAAGERLTDVRSREAKTIGLLKTW